MLRLELGCSTAFSGKAPAWAGGVANRSIATLCYVATVASAYKALLHATPPALVAGPYSCTIAGPILPLARSPSRRRLKVVRAFLSAALMVRARHALPPFLDQHHAGAARIFTAGRCGLRLAVVQIRKAALEIGMTFDPVFLAERGVVGFTPDGAQAREWYDKARELGSTEASSHIEQLTRFHGHRR